MQLSRAMVSDSAADVRPSERPRLRNANTQAIALTGSTSAIVTTASPATASGGAYVGSRVAPGM
jgi:hypothetical protein